MKPYYAVLFLMLCLPLSAAQASENPHGPDWQYQGETGPEHWADVDPSFDACRSGRLQAPIDIVESQRKEDLSLVFAYQPSTATLVNNGHSIQVTLEGAGDLQTEDGAFRLLQFHFHTPSEERIGGQSFPMAAHFVHSDAEGRLAAVTVLFREGEYNNLWQPILAALPETQGGSHALETPVDASRLVPVASGFYSFIGSLTAPPCTEGVRWFVLKEPVALSAEQIAAFTRLYPMNSRPTQPVNDRVVVESP